MYVYSKNGFIFRAIYIYIYMVMGKVLLLFCIHRKFLASFLVFPFRMNARRQYFLTGCPLKQNREHTTPGRFSTDDV